MPTQLPILTELQHRTLRLLARGLSQTEIARREGLRSQAIQNRVNRIIKKLGAKSSFEAIAIAVRRGLV